MLSSEYETISELITEQLLSSILLRTEFVNRLAVGKIRMSDIHPVVRNEYNEVN